MNAFALNVIEKNDSTEPMIDFILSRGDQEVFRREGRIFSEDDMIAASNEIVRLGGVKSADADQMIAELVQPIRTKMLRSREEPEEKKEEQAEGPQAADQQYVAVMPNADGTEPREVGVYQFARTQMQKLTNFVLLIDEEVQVHDDIESRHEFMGRMILSGRTVPFRIDVKDYPNDGKLMAALYAAGGSRIQVRCKPAFFRTAVAEIGERQGSVKRRRTTTNFGWNGDKTAYLTPSVEINEAGVRQMGDDDEIRVHLSSQQPVNRLDMKKLDADEVRRVKKHIVDDLLKLNESAVTHMLLGATAAAVLYPFAKGAGRFALWLVGRTGAGKSYVSKLFANFFGDFPISTTQFSTWISTGNFIQQQGYFFKDAMYLVDDYKPDLKRNPSEVINVLQAYGDGAPRGRLKADATANVSRPIRGLLICTGEDVPEHQASAVARSIIVQVPQGENIVSGKRCVAECSNYSGVMADFIRWLLGEDRIARFAMRFDELQERLKGGVGRQQNGVRIATNLAQLGAAFELFAEYLGDVWPEWKEAVKALEDDLVAKRDAMLGEAKEQQVSEVFLSTLADLIRGDQVHVVDLPGHSRALHKDAIGKFVPVRPTPETLSAPRGNGGRFEIRTSLALAAVNQCLRTQGRTELKSTIPALLRQLREDGKLLDANGDPLAAGAAATKQIRVGGRQSWAFSISKKDLFGDE